MTTPPLRQQLTRIAAMALLALFLVPGLTWLLAGHFKQSTDARYLEAINASIDGSGNLSAAERQKAHTYFQSLPPSSTCFSDDPALAPYRAQACSSMSELWQFVVVEKAAFWTVIGGVLLLVLMLALGALAFARREVQYASFVFGWRVLTLASAAEVVLQGLFAVWLSFWITAFFFNIYIIKLIAIAGVIAALAMFNAVVAIFRRARMNNEVQGELVGPDEAPALWARIREFAARLGTAPPAQIVAGIDANFFVTEQPLRVQDRDTQGRSLFVSIPLLRVLDQHEADAVLAHELGHFVHGDTASSAALGPKLLQYDYYTEQMRVGGATVIAFYLLHLYRVIFEIALQRASREREFAADRRAAELTSAKAISHSLIKVAAYSTYRNQVQGKLFEQMQQHSGDLGIAQLVARGLNEFGQSREFVESMRAGDVPHPFDTHPPLRERMASVGYELPEPQFAEVICQAPASTWAESIGTADAIEKRLWQAFEQRFAQIHEQNLAYRFEPANEEERALVLKYFPPVRFAMKRGKTFEINHEGLVLPGQQETLGWDRVKKLRYQDSSLGGDKLTIEHPEKGMLGAKQTKVSLTIKSAERARLKETLGKYWHRHQVMRKQV